MVEHDDDDDEVVMLRLDEWKKTVRAPKAAEFPDRKTLSGAPAGLSWSSWMARCALQQSRKIVCLNNKSHQHSDDIGSSAIHINTNVKYVIMCVYYNTS